MAGAFGAGQAVFAEGNAPAVRVVDGQADHLVGKHRGNDADAALRLRQRCDGSEGVFKQVAEDGAEVGFLHGKSGRQAQFALDARFALFRDRGVVRDDGVDGAVSAIGAVGAAGLFGKGEQVLAQLFELTGAGKIADDEQVLAKVVPQGAGAFHVASQFFIALAFQLQQGVFLLKAGAPSAESGSDEELRETAGRLQSTLQNFGINVKITDISQGPTVTRYELQPEEGVRVSKIVSLSDDIKLSLAATDIRIEAPIPGKSAIGIEVPNRVASVVALRDILITKAFQTQKSKISFGVGKDIAGQPVIGDIAKMPHVLIAGATGSGKSVCINTIIMSILFHATPEEVKLILIDPKIVELSVYNGIPHLMIPVVTDPQKAAAALQWGVAEMESRYRRFADAKVRDIKGYNAMIQAKLDAGQTEDEEGNTIRLMPRIVIIVDELADLMMVAKNDVETAICRLAQLARACGIHLVIATQRPSVNVITGLIKANMPSRIAFAVTNGVDSRTILDMNGAEKLLGKGDMLFFPQGLPKPARIQGAFVSDEEVTDVVAFLKENDPPKESPDELDKKLEGMSSRSQGQEDGGGGTDAGPDQDELFEKAGRFIIEKNNASIGLLQRGFRIGFNRAARIMDQLCEAGVVGDAEGTKKREILMDEAQFDALIRSMGTQ